MRRNLLYTLVLLLGLNGLQAGIFHNIGNLARGELGCDKKLVDSIVGGKLKGKALDAKKKKLKKCVGLKGNKKDLAKKLAKNHPTLTKSLLDNCGKKKFFNSFKAQCSVAKLTDSSAAGDDSAKAKSGSKKHKGSKRNQGGNSDDGVCPPCAPMPSAPPSYGQSQAGYQAPQMGTPSHQQAMYGGYQSPQMSAPPQQAGYGYQSSQQMGYGYQDQQMVAQQQEHNQQLLQQLYQQVLQAQQQLAQAQQQYEHAQQQLQASYQPQPGQAY